MAYHHYRSPFGDTTLTKVFVGGLAWETPTNVLHEYFEQFGDILEAVIIADKNTGKSKGYGFVTFRDAESARRACAEPNPVIDGRKANCNIASLGRPSPPRGRTQGGGSLSSSSSSYSGVPGVALAPPVPPPPPTVIYPPYGYSPYPSDYGYPQGMYNQQVQQQQQQAQYYQQAYGVGVSSPSAISSPAYYYGYPMHATRGTFYSASQRIPPPQSYPYYHHLTHMPQQQQQQQEVSSFPSYPPPPLLLQPPRLSFPPPSPDPQTLQQTSTDQTEAAADAITSQSPKT